MHHIAISTADMKGQIEYFTDVLGARLVGLYWMHGTEGKWHGFLELANGSSVAFVCGPDMKDIPAKLDVTHARTPGHSCAPGTMQHFAFNVDNDEELLAMRDRIRSRGIVVFGPIDHGMCKSIYFAGLEGLNLEVSTSKERIDQEIWIDPEVVAMVGISSEELKRYKAPAAFAAQTGSVPQPAYDPSKPHMHYPDEQYRAMISMPDDVLSAASNYSQPPVKRSTAA
jgi:catechol 2,3-dioxygenase-like lactoylglutathione lyase family enzyme